MNESVGFAITVTGGVIALIGWLWMVVVGFRASLFWGIGVFLFPPTLIGLVVNHTRRAIYPFLTILVGLLLSAFPFAYTMAFGTTPAPKPIETFEKGTGEVDLILSKVENVNYAEKLAKKHYVKLIINNPDVTDETLQYLVGFDKLRELDLDNTKVTDAGLAIIKELPQLETLRLRGTAITDSGFVEHLLDKESLMELDLRQTQVDRKTFAKWKAAKEGRKGFR